MLFLNIYYFITIIITSYYFYDLYKIKNSFYLFSIHLTNSLFYICLSINLIIMIFIFINNLIIYILFGRIIFRELTEIKSEYIIKFSLIINSFDVIIMQKTKNVEEKFFLHLLGIYISLISELAYNRGEYFNSNNVINKLKQLKMILRYTLLVFVNYFLYDLTIPEMPNKLNIYELFISYIINYNFYSCFIKIVDAFYKLVINITSINMQKFWNYKIFAFDIISIIKYVLYLLYELRINYFLIINYAYRSYFFIFCIFSIYNLFILIKRLNANISYIKYIDSLNDFVIKRELALQGKINNNEIEGKINTIKNEINYCIICLSEVEKGKYLNCGHIFHFNCIKKWALLYKKCPTCNWPIKINSKEKSEFYNQRLGIINIEKEKNINDMNGKNNSNENQIYNNILKINEQKNKLKKEEIKESSNLQNKENNEN